MDASKKELLLSQLEAEVRKVGSEVNLTTLENQQLSLSFFTPIYDDGSGLVFFELGMVDYADEFTLFQIVATLLPEIGKNLPVLEKMIARWNLSALTGAYGVYYPLDQMYYKNRFLLDEDSEPDALLPMIMNNLYLAYEEIADKYDAAVLIVDGKLSYEQAVVNNL